MIEPSDETVQKLIELQVIEPKNGKYVYSSEFEKTADEIKKHPPGFFEGAKLAKEVEENCTPVLITYARYFKSQHEIKNLATAYVLLVKHLKRLDIKEKLEPSAIYGAYYFNNHDLSVQ
jgi:hypothetical protein